MNSCYNSHMTRKPDIESEFLDTSSRFIDLSLIVNEMSGLNLAIYPPNSLKEVKITDTNINPCCNWLRNTQYGLLQCNRCERKRFQKVIQSKQCVIEKCHAGFLDIALPLIEHDKVVGIISTGQILSEPHSAEAFARLKSCLVPLGVPEKLIHKTYPDLIYLPTKKLSAIIKLLEFFAAYFFDTRQGFNNLIRGEHPAIASLKRHIKEHPDSDLSLSKLAQISGYSPWHLCRLFQQHTGKKLSDFIQETRINRAKYLLTNTDLSITRIAMTAGFGSICHFNRLFRQLEKNSPSKFRQTWK